nr:anti-sigma factor [Actinomycetota bacterium]
VPLRARAAWRATAGLAAAAAVVAVLLGAWAMSLRNSLDETRSALASQAHATAILSDPESRQVALRGRAGRLVISPAGEAALVVSGLRPAPDSKIYRIWVEEQGTPHLAARFHAEQGRDVVELTRTVPSGAKVLVTLEPDDDRTAPSVKPFITARA